MPCKVFLSDGPIMGERRLKGSRLGAVSYETDRNIGVPAHQVARYRTANGSEFDVPFADDADVPGTWSCRNGMEGILVNGVAPEPKTVKPTRTHWDMVRERRSMDDLEVLFKERLKIIESARRRT
jgi:hypothetical protein